MVLSKGHLVRVTLYSCPKARDTTCTLDLSQLLAFVGRGQRPHVLRSAPHVFRSSYCFNPVSVNETLAVVRWMSWIPPTSRGWVPHTPLSFRRMVHAPYIKPPNLLGKSNTTKNDVHSFLRISSLVTVPCSLTTHLDSLGRAKQHPTKFAADTRMPEHHNQMVHRHTVYTAAPDGVWDNTKEIQYRTPIRS